MPTSYSKRSKRTEWWTASNAALRSKHDQNDSNTQPSQPLLTDYSQSLTGRVSVLRTPPNPEWNLSRISFSDSFFFLKGVICDETAFLSPLLKIWGRAECFSRPCRLEWLGGCESEASHAGVTRYLNSFFTFHSVRRRKKEAQKHILRRQLNILNTFICLFWHVWNVPERSHLSHTKAGMNGF